MEHPALFFGLLPYFIGLLPYFIGLLPYFIGLRALPIRAPARPTHPLRVYFAPDIVRVSDPLTQRSFYGAAR